MRSDWVSPWWQALLLPSLWDVAGVRVRPLSVWHVFALTNLGNRFFAAESAQAPTMDDAQSLLMLATLDFRRGSALLQPQYAQRRARRMRRFYRKLSCLPEKDVLAACSEYVTVSMRRAHRMSQSDVSGTPAGTPEAWAIHVLLRRMGESREGAWDYPYTEGRCALDASDEHAGNATMTPWWYGEEMLDNWDSYKDLTGTRDLVLN